MKFRGKTPNQETYISCLKEKTITFCHGPSGSGKSWLACAVANQLLEQGNIKKIVITRPLITCGKVVGSLPGYLDEKVGPYMRHLQEAFEDIIGDKEMGKLMKAKIIEMRPLEMLRGSSIKNSFIICDETQNAEFEQLEMLLTRIDAGSKMVLCGDPSQTDLRNKESAFSDIVQKFSINCHSDIGIVELTKVDIVRHPLISWMLDRLHPEAA